MICETKDGGTLQACEQLPGQGITGMRNAPVRTGRDA